MAGGKAVCFQYVMCQRRGLFLCQYHKSANPHNIPLDIRLIHTTQLCDIFVMWNYPYRVVNPARNRRVHAHIPICDGITFLLCLADLWIIFLCDCDITSHKDQIPNVTTSHFYRSIFF